MFIVASNLNLGQDTRAFWVFVAYPIESCAVWEGEPAQYTGMPLRRALMERYSGVALAVSEHRGRGVRAISDGACGMVAAIAVAMVVEWGLRDRPSKRATATAAMAAMVVRETGCWMAMAAMAMAMAAMTMAAMAAMVMAAEARMPEVRAVEARAAKARAVEARAATARAMEARAVEAARAAKARAAEARAAQVRAAVK